MLVSLLIVSDFSVAPSLFISTKDLKQWNVNLEKDSWVLSPQVSSINSGWAPTQSSIWRSGGET